MLLGVTGKKSKRKIWMQLRNKIELYKIRRVLKPIGCVSAQRREERLIISFNGNWLGYIEKGKLHIKDSEVSYQKYICQKQQLFWMIAGKSTERLTEN